MKMDFSRDEDCAPASEAALAALEGKHGISLPPSYRAFLASSGGGYPARDWSRFGEDGDFVAHIYGLHEGAEWKRLDHAISDFGHDLSRFLPVAVSNGGNYFLLQLTEPDRGAMFFWDDELEDPGSPTFEEVIRVSNTFDEWMDSLEEAKD